MFGIVEPTMSSNPVKNTTTINENYPTVTDTDFDHMVTANDHVVNSETSNCLSQSPLNLTRSQGLLNFVRPYNYIYERL